MNNVIELKFTPLTKDLYEVEFKGGIEGKEPDLLFGLKNVRSFDRSKYHDYQKARAKLYKYKLLRGVDEPEIEIDRDLDLDCQTLTDDFRINLKEVNVENKHDNERNRQAFEESAKTLLTTLNDWGRSPEFAKIRKAIVDRQENLRVTISSECPDLRKQPFHQWNLFPDGVEVVFSGVEAARLPRFYREKIRILIILGDSRGIDIEKDKKAIEQYCKNDAEAPTILAQPTRIELKEALADRQGWDIIFFSGHSHTENTNTGRICINATDSLTMDELQDVLKPAIEQRVQIAIFNSCDGLGIALVLERLNIDRIIVMREPIPDKIAQEFLKSFLQAFTHGKRFDDAVKFARQELVNLEQDYPYVSWLPIIIQNRLAPSITWQGLGKVQSPYKGLFAFTEADADNFYGR
ncbi:CHAT domain-containing protein [Chamaesiphon sp. VAR_48_metabat_403]|uniref:CHAT domain-containing protein n=1 Tax=Chamaesiphon sp. VAR_48_metabat_403 TaxID=2964700 RepID=UPI00286DB93B|nr:CHAT domain-containing protein [Chamaesiphon sp. VAR_48_metabat_403]